MSRILPPATAFSVRTKKVRTKPKVRSIQMLDAIFSRCVREAADWTCERCGKAYERGAQNLHCSHLWGRRLRSGRWNPLNAVAHDAACHMLLGENPELFSEWIREHHGGIHSDRYQRWYALRQQVVKVRAKDREDIYQHFVRVHAEMLACRDRGITGRIEFRGYPS